MSRNLNLIFKFVFQWNFCAAKNFNQFSRETFGWCSRNCNWNLEMWQKNANILFLVALYDFSFVLCSCPKSGQCVYVGNLLFELTSWNNMKLNKKIVLRVSIKLFVGKIFLIFDLLSSSWLSSLRKSILTRTQGRFIFSVSHL